MDKTQEILERAVERSTGMKVEDIRKMTLWEFREMIEKKHGKSMVFTVNQPNLISHEQIERDLDRLFD